MNLSDFDDTKPGPEPKGPRRKSAGGDVGNALRKVYDRALNEDIPSSMLDLLGKLD